jgi:hypothetical protein
MRLLKKHKLSSSSPLSQKSKSHQLIQLIIFPADRNHHHIVPTNHDTGEQYYIEHRVRGTLGDDRLVPFGLTSSTTAEAEVFKSFSNMVVSRASIYFTMDIKDFYLGTTLPLKPKKTTSPFPCC